MNNNEDFDNLFEQSNNDDQKEIDSIDKKVKKKRRKSKISLSIFVLLLAVGVVGNWYWENSSISEKIEPVISSSDNSSKTLGEASYVDATTETTTVVNEYFTNAKLNRETARDEVLDNLQAVIDSPEESDSAKEIASEDIARVSSYISIENKIETLVTAKNINNCLAVISDDGGSVEIIVDEKDLSEKTIVQIKEIAIKQLGCTYDNVSIIQSK